VTSSALVSKRGVIRRGDRERAWRGKSVNKPSYQNGRKRAKTKVSDAGERETKPPRREKEDGDLDG